MATTVLFLSQNSGTGSLTSLISGFAWTDTGSGNRMAIYCLTVAQLAGLAASLPGTAQARLYREGIESHSSPSVLQTKYQAAATAYFASPAQGIVTDIVDPAIVVGGSGYVLQNATVRFSDLTKAIRIRKVDNVVIDNVTIVGYRDDSGAATIGINNLLADLNIAECTGSIVVNNVDFVGGSRGMVRINQPGSLSDSIRFTSNHGYNSGANYTLQLVEIGPGGYYNTEAMCDKYDVAFTAPDTRPYLYGGQTAIGFLGTRNESHLIELESETSAFTIDISELTDSINDSETYRAPYDERNWWLCSEDLIAHDVRCVAGSLSEVTIESDVPLPPGLYSFGCYSEDDFTKNLHIENNEFIGHPGTIGSGCGIAVYGIHGLSWIAPNGNECADYANGCEWIINGSIIGPRGVKRSGGSNNVFELTYLQRNVTVKHSGVTVGTVSNGVLQEGINLEVCNSVAHAVNQSTTIGEADIMSRFNPYVGTVVNGAAYSPEFTYLNPSEYADRIGEAGSIDP